MGRVVGRADAGGVGHVAKVRGGQEDLPLLLRGGKADPRPPDRIAVDREGVGIVDVVARRNLALRCLAACRK